MHTKTFNGFEIKFPGPDLYEDEIRSAMEILNQLIEDIDSYPDKNEMMTYPFPFKFLQEYLDDACEVTFSKHWNEITSNLQLI